MPLIVQRKDSTSNYTQHYVSDIVKKTEDGDLDSKAEIGGNETGGREVLDHHNNVCDDDDLTDFLYEESDVHTEQRHGQGQDQELGEEDESKGNGKENNSQSDTGDTLSHRKIGADGSDNVTSIVSDVSEEKVEALGVVPLEPVLTQAVHTAGGRGGGGGLRKITKKKVNTVLVPDPELQLQLQLLPLPLPLHSPLSHGDANTVAYGDGDVDGGAISAVAAIESTADPVPDDDNAENKNISIDERELKYSENSNNDAQDVEIEVEGDVENVETVKMKVASLVKKNDRAIYCELPLSVAALGGDIDSGRCIGGEGQEEVDDHSVNGVIANEDGGGKLGDEEEGGNEVSHDTQTILPFKTDANALLCENEVEIDLAEIKD